MNKLVTQSAEKFEDYVNTNGPLIGFDLGTKTIGVAVSDISRTIATPVTVIKRKKFLDDLEKIKDLEKVRICWYNFRFANKYEWN